MTELIGLILPPFIDLLNRFVKDTQIRFWISVAVCVLVGVGIHIVNGGVNDLNEVAKSIMSVFGLAQLSYKAVYEDSKMQETLRG